jgi:hypothetical protein
MSLQNDLVHSNIYGTVPYMLVGKPRAEGVNESHHGHIILGDRDISCVAYHHTYRSSQASEHKTQKQKQAEHHDSQPQPKPH